MGQINGYVYDAVILLQASSNRHNGAGTVEHPAIRLLLLDASNTLVTRASPDIEFGETCANCDQAVEWALVWLSDNRKQLFDDVNDRIGGAG